MDKLIEDLRFRALHCDHMQRMFERLGDELRANYWRKRRALINRWINRHTAEGR